MELDDRRLALRVGILICVGLGIIVAMIVFFQNISFSRNFYTVEATFPFGGGIQRGTPVRIAGYNVGRVSKVIWDSDTQLVRSTLQIDVTHRVKRDAILVLDSEGMLGEVYLEFTAGSPEAPDLEPGTIVKGEVPPTMTQMKVESLQMIQKITGAVSQIESLANHLNSVAADEDFKNNLRTTVESTAKIADQAARSAEGFRRISEDVSNVMKGVDTLIAKLNKTADELALQVKDRGEQTGNVLTEAEGLLKGLRKSQNKLQEGMDNIADISFQIRKGDGTVHKLIYEKELYDHTNNLVKEANVAVSRLADLAKYLRHNPSHLVWGAEPSWYKRWWRRVLGSTYGEEDEEGSDYSKDNESPNRGHREEEEKINLMETGFGTHEEPEPVPEDNKDSGDKPAEDAPEKEVPAEKAVENTQKSEENAPAEK